MLDNLKIASKLINKKFKKIQDNNWKETNNPRPIKFDLNGKSYYETIFYKKKIKNLTIKYFPNSEELEIVGSWNKFVKDNNVQQVSVFEYLETYGKICRELGIDILDLKLTKLEFGFTVELDHKVREYLSNFHIHTNKSWLKSSINNNQTVQFGIENRHIIYYDKVAELRNKSKYDTRIKKVYEEYKDKNILRIEFVDRKPRWKLFHRKSSDTLKSHTPKPFNMDNISFARKLKNEKARITVRDILEPANWIHMLDYLEDQHFNKIIKTTTLTKKGSVKGPKDFEKLCAAYGFKTMQSKGINVSNLKPGKTRVAQEIRKKIKEYNTSKFFPRPNKKMKELDSKVSKTVSDMKEDLYKHFFHS